MNKELIKLYKAEFDHWLNGGKILFKYNINDKEWLHRSSKHMWDCSTSLNVVYVIDDKYVEFRKAAAEGKIIQRYHIEVLEFGASKTMWIDIEIDDVCKYPISSLRIKPRKHQFKAGEWCWFSVFNACIPTMLKITQEHLDSPELLEHCEPFIGQLPESLKDN